jgi:hypothetical protein
MRRQADINEVKKCFLNLITKAFLITLYITVAAVAA